MAIDRRLAQHGTICEVCERRQALYTTQLYARTMTINHCRICSPHGIGKPEKPQKRICLKCDKKFKSVSKINKVCEGCKGTKDWKSTRYTYT